MTDSSDRDMCGLLLALLDRIEIEEDPTLARQRFDIAEQCGYVVEILPLPTSGAMQ